jgi:hypothetical protein
MKTKNDLVREGARSRAARTVCAQVDELKSIVADLRQKRMDHRYIHDVERDGLRCIKQDLLTNSEEEKQRIMSRMAELEQHYAKSIRENRTTYHDAIETARARYSAMSNLELQRETTKVMDRPMSGRDPMELDYLCSELRSRNLVVEHSEVRTALTKSDYTRPWLHSDEGQALKREASFYERAKPGTFLIELPSVSGELQLAGADVEAMYGGE